MQCRTPSGISVVDHAAAALRPELTSRMGELEGTPLPDYQPPRVNLRAAGCARADSVPRRAALGVRIRSRQRSTLPGPGTRPRCSPPNRICRMRRAKCQASRVHSALQWMKHCPDLEHWATAQVARWAEGAHQLAAATAHWRSVLAPEVKTVLPPDYNGPLHRAMLDASGHADLAVCDDIERGFPMAGLMPDSMLFGSADRGHLPNRRDLADALQHALQRLDRTLKDLLSKPRQEPGTQDILRQTQEYVAAGKMEGPWEVPRVQHRAANSYDVRPIDSCTASGLNPAATAIEAMRVTGLSALMATIQHVAEVFQDWGSDGEPLLAKGEHKKACRQWPVRPDERNYVVTQVWSDDVGTEGGFLAFAHIALPFGALGAVWGCARVGGSVCHALQRLFAVPQMAYVDDFFRASPRRFAA
ncbi:unnamed protein product, partial [Prorocentrum cordatum]